MRGRIRTYWMPANFLALVRTPGCNIGKLTAWCVGVVIVVRVTTRSFLYLLQYFLLWSLKYLHPQGKLHVSALTVNEVLSWLQWTWHETFHFFVQSFLLVQQFSPRTVSCAPYDSHMDWGASHSSRIAHMVVPLSSPFTSHRSHVGSLFLSLSSCAITHGEAYLYLETARESRRLFEALNTCWVPLAVRNCFGLYHCSFSWGKPVGPSSALANSLGLMSPFWRLCTLCCGRKLLVPA